MALYLLNISVDTADLKPERIPEDLSFNDQESLVEIVIEKLLGFEDVIREYDDHDTEDFKQKNNGKIDLLLPVIKLSQLKLHQFLKLKGSFPPFKAALRNGFIKIDSPPPKF